MCDDALGRVREKRPEGREQRVGEMSGTDRECACDAGSKNKDGGCDSFNIQEIGWGERTSPSPCGWETVGSPHKPKLGIYLPVGGPHLKSGRADTTPNDDDELAGRSIALLFPSFPATRRCRSSRPLSLPRLSRSSPLSRATEATLTPTSVALVSPLTLWLRDCADAPGLPSSRLASSTTSETRSTKCVLCPITLWFLICYND